jgi:hypothetical protein
MTKSNASGGKRPADTRFDPSAIRGTLGKTFLTRLAADFSRHGGRIFPRLRKQRQLDYLKLVAAVLPQEYRLKEVSFQDVSDQELAAMLSVLRAAIAEKEKEQGGEGGLAGREADAGDTERANAAVRRSDMQSR